MFWLPESPTTKIHGRLTFNQKDGAILELNGVFKNGFRRLPDHELILGNVEGKPWTFYRTYYKQTMRFGMGERAHSTSTIGVLYAFAGAHIDPEKTTFSEIRIRFTKLEEWLNHFAFQSPKGVKTSSLGTFVPYPTPSVNVPTLNGKVGFGYTLHSHSASFDEMHWRGELYLKITVEAPKPFFDYFFEAMFQLRDLMTLLMGKAVHPIEVELLSGDDKVEFLQDSPRAQAEPNFNFHRMLTLYPNVKDVWSTIVVNWFENAEPLKSARILFFGTMYFQHPIELGFLTLIQAVESFHRANSKCTYLSESEYRSRVYEPMAKSIPSDVEPSLRDSLKAKLRYGNEVSLRKRLNLIFKSLPPELLEFVGFDKSETIGMLVDNRNYFTHYSSELEAKKADPLTLLDLSKGLETVLFYLFYKVAGIPDEKFLDNLIHLRQHLFKKRQ